MSQPFKLYRLQQVDSQLGKTQTRLHEIDVILQNDAAIRQAEAVTSSAEHELQATQKDLRRAEQETKAQRAKIKQTENRLYGGTVRNPKELQDLQNESAALKRYLEVLEERQLEAMMAVDEADEVFQTAQKRWDDAKAEAVSSHAALNGEKTKLLHNVNRLTSERDTMSANIPADDLAIYERLRTKRRGIAVAKVSSKACDACGVTLTSSLFQSARSPNQLSYCETCGRILYVG